MKKCLFLNLIFLLCACNNKDIKEIEFSTNMKVGVVEGKEGINVFIHKNPKDSLWTYIHITDENALLEFHNSLIKCERIIKEWQQIVIDNKVTNFRKIIPIKFPEVYDREKHVNCLMNDEDYFYNIQVIFHYKTINGKINNSYFNMLHGEFYVCDKGNVYFHLLTSENIAFWRMTLEELNWLINQTNPYFVKQIIKEKKEIDALFKSEDISIVPFTEEIKIYK